MFLLNNERLQVGRIGVRTLFQILFAIASVVFCVVLIMNAFETEYSGSVDTNLTDSTAQITEYLKPIVNREVLAQSDQSRADYVSRRYTDVLNSCFVSDDIAHAGAIYMVSDAMPFLTAKSDEYTETLPEQMQNALIASVSSGAESTHDFDGLAVTFAPLTDSEGKVYAVLAVTAQKRNSMQYSGTVRNRLILFAAICSLSIVIYYTLSGVAAWHNKRRKAVIVK